MSISAMGAAAGNGSGPATQLATITATNIFTGEVTCQVDGADTTCSVRSDATRRAFPATVGDRILVTRVGSEMYEVSVVQSAYAFFYPNSPYIAYGITADQSIASGAGVTILWNNSLATARVFAAPSAGTFTIPLTGLYMIHARINWATVTAASTRRFVALVINGALDTRTENANAIVGHWVTQVTDMRLLTAGDTVAVQGFHAATGAINAMATDASGTVPGTTIKMAKIG